MELKDNISRQFSTSCPRDLDPFCMYVIGKILARARRQYVCKRVAKQLRDECGVYYSIPTPPQHTQKRVCVCVCVCERACVCVCGILLNLSLISSNAVKGPTKMTFRNVENIKIVFSIFLSFMLILNKLRVSKRFAWINNYIHYNVWDEITYQFSSTVQPLMFGNG